MKLNFKKQLTNLDGAIIVDENNSPLMLNKILSNLLVLAKTGDSLKLYDIATKLHTIGEIELDTTDTALLKTFIEGLPDLPVLTKAQLLKVFYE